jgi:hypothetical protein
LKDKADVANLAATCRNYRRALSDHVKRHAILFPTTFITGNENNLRMQFWQRRYEQEWNALVAERILRIFPLRLDGTHYKYQGVGYTVNFCCSLHYQRDWIMMYDGIGFGFPLRKGVTIESQDTLDIYNRALVETATLRNAIEQLRQDFK